MNIKKETERITSANAREESQPLAPTPEMITPPTQEAKSPPQGEEVDTKMPPPPPYLDFHRLAPNNQDGQSPIIPTESEMEPPPHPPDGTPLPNVWIYE